MYDPEYIVVYDTETNGLDEKQNEILEICAKKYRRGNKECVDKLYYLCAPESGFISPECSKINGITMDKVQGQPSFFKEAAPKFYDMCRGNLIVGHNIAGFDNKFTKIDPQHMYDTMLEYRKKFPGKKSKLGTACKELKIKFNEDEAHSAEYDVDKTAELYFALTGEGDIRISAIPADVAEPIVAEQQSAVEQAVQAGDIKAVEVKHGGRINLGVDDIKRAVDSMAYSFSKLTAFQSCPFKWYKDYIEKYKFQEKTYFAVGRTCHTVAERSAIWCYQEAFSRRFEIAVKSNAVKVDQAWMESMKPKVKAELGDFSIQLFGRWLYDHPEEIKAGLGVKRSHLVMACADAMDPDDMEATAVFTPDDVTYEQIVNKAIIENKVLDDNIVNDIRYICRTFKRNYSFDTGGKALILSETKVAFDKDWNVKDWFANGLYWRGIIDYIEYHDTHVVIRDYKSSRKMKTVKELMADMQLKSYVANVVRMLPQTRKMPIRVEMVYMRYGEVVGFDIEDVETLLSEVDEWIANVVEEIQSETKKPVSDMFSPIRNEFCDTCDYCSEAMCPLFTKREQSTISEPSSFIVNSDETCVMAWKQAEANKAEAKALEAKVKSYLKVRDGVKVDVGGDEAVKIDKMADLAIFCDPKRDYDTAGMARFFMTKAKDSGVDSATVLSNIFKEVSMSQTAVTKLCDGLKIKQEDIPADLWKVKYTNTLACRVPGAEDIEG